MIVTDLHRAARQTPAHPRLASALAFLRGRDLAALPEGRTAIDGERVFALVQEYETEPSDAPTFEVHGGYLDVQFVVSGEEILGWAPAALMKVTEAYDPERDVCFGKVERGLWSPVRLGAGELALLWPEDAHAPRLALLGPSRVRKVVVKVAL